MASVANALIALARRVCRRSTFSSQMMSDLNCLRLPRSLPQIELAAASSWGGTATIPMETGGGEALPVLGVAERPTGF